MRRNVVTDRMPLLPFTICLMAGIVAGFTLSVSFPLWPLLAVSLLPAFFLGRHAILQTLVLEVTTFLLGMTLATRQWQSLHQYSYDNHVHRLHAIVASEPSEGARSVFTEVLLTDGPRKLRCYFAKNERSRQLKPGDGLLLRTRIRPCGGDRAPSYYRTYMERSGYTGECYVNDRQWHLHQVSLSSLPRLDRLRIVFLSLRHQLLERYQLMGAADDSYGVLAAMTLGDKSALTRELRDVYSVTGAGHVLALSGLHLGILYILLSRILFTRRRHRVWSQAVLVVAIWAFVMLVGMPISVVRSAIMVSIFAIFSVGHRPAASVNLLCLAAFLILSLNPYALYDVGFQLSFMAMLSILLLLPLLERRQSSEFDTTSLWSRLKQSVVGCITLSLAVQVGVAPLIAFYFGRFPTYFLLTNLVVLPAAYLILCGALLMLLIPAVAPVVLWVVSQLNQLLSLMSLLPFSSIEGLHPSPAQLVVCYLIIATLGAAAYTWKYGWPREKKSWLT